MNRNDWQNAFGPAPDAFRERVDNTLNRLEEREMRKRTKFATAMIAAVLTTVLLAGVAFAATKLNIWEALDYADPIIPLDGADELVATDLASAENDYFRVSVQEGVYDGYGAIVKLRFEPKDPEKYVLLTDFATLYHVDDEYITEAVHEYEDGFQDKRIVGRKDGKEIIFLSTPNLTLRNQIEDTDSFALLHLFNTFRDQYNSDGSAEFWISGVHAENLPDVLSIALNVRGMDADYNTAYGIIENLTFDLIKNNKERTVNLVPSEPLSIKGFELIDAKIHFTEVRGYISVKYTGSVADKNHGTDVNLNLLDADGKQIHLGGGYCTELENGHYCWMLEMQSFEEIPKTMTLEVCVINETHQIECTVEEIAA